VSHPIPESRDDGVWFRNGKIFCNKVDSWEQCAVGTALLMKFQRRLDDMAAQSAAQRCCGALAVLQRGALCRTQ
jgi:hypothetical protein